MSNINDVAARAGVSAMTVSRVLNNKGRVSAQTRETVLKAVKDLNYVPNQLARSLVRGRSQMLALLVTDITNPFFTTIARGVEDIAWRNGYRVMLCNTDEDAAKESKYVEDLVSSQVSGVVMAPAGPLSLRSIKQLRQHNIPTVLIDRDIEGAACDLVIGDSLGGAHALTNHLVSLGHRRIALVSGPLSVSTARDRYTGYHRALAEAGIPPDPALEFEVPYKQAGGHEAAAMLLKLRERPTAVFCGNNLQAVGLILALRTAGVRIPDDLALCCFDDVELASTLDPFLTVAVQPAYSFGSLATELLLERVGGLVPSQPRRVVMQVSIAERRSTLGAVPAAVR